MSDESLIEPFVVRYSYRHEDVVGIDAIKYAESLHGHAILYRYVAEHIANALLDRPRPSVRGRRLFTPRVSTQVQGSCLQPWAIDAAILAPVIHPYGTQIFGACFKILVNAVIDMVARPRRDPMAIIERQIDRSYEDRREQRQFILDLVAEISHRSPRTMADRLTKSVNRAVEPIGDDCDSITSFVGTEHERAYTEDDADAIRSAGEQEVGETITYELARILKLDVSTGFCRVQLASEPALTVRGRITDPVLRQPLDPYSQALTTRSPLRVKAKGVTQGGELVRLYISDTAMPQTGQAR